MAQITEWGEVGGKPVQRIGLEAASGLRLVLTTLGARLVQLWAPDRGGMLADVVLGFDRAEDYLTRGGYLGATCGRFANRIAGGRFALDGRTVQLVCNEGANQLHGGPAGFDAQVWDIADHARDHVTFRLMSPDGDMGYPGQVEAHCTYRLSGLRLTIEMTATTDAPTVVNMAQHSYFNLAGHGGVMDHHLQVAAPHYLPVDGANIPTGEIRPVTGTAFDFRQSRPIGQTLPGPGGFDHCLCLADPGVLRPCASLSDPASGRRLRIATDAPGLQVYTGGHFDGGPGKSGARHPRFAGVALETQGFPDAPNQPDFPSSRLDPGQIYRHRMQLDMTPDPT